MPVYVGNGAIVGPKNMFNRRSSVHEEVPNQPVLKMSMEDRGSRFQRCSQLLTGGRDNILVV